MHLIAFTLRCLMLVVSVKAQYEKLFTSGPAFVNFPYPTIPLNCSEIGPSGSPLGVDHMAFDPVGAPDRSPGPQLQDYTEVP